ncbi:MAG: UbiD family decarboxylase [Magnetococcales bacterium]|nr:UbiD family decarboxylase [Magnetococcales bacterium]
MDRTGKPNGPFRDLRAFMRFLEARGELIRVDAPVDPRLEMTEISRRLLERRGPAVLFTKVGKGEFPVLANLFGTEERVAWAIGHDPAELESLGEFLAELRQPTPPAGIRDLLNLGKRLLRVRHMPPRTVRRAPCQQVIWEGLDLDLERLPIQTCWPEDAAPLMTWPLVITRGPQGGPVNLGVYRMQRLGRDRLIMRWLAHRGGALHAAQYSAPVPVAVAIGADPATMVAAVTPVPETLSEYAFAGLLRRSRVEVIQGRGVPLPVPAQAEMVLEGEVDLQDQALEGPFGDHTGYYNEAERFPVFTVRRLTLRQDAIYVSTFTGRPPDEPAILAVTLNRLFVPFLRKQFPEIRDFYLPMASCSYRLAVVAVDKRYPGHAFRVMAAVWSVLRQFLYTKFVVVVDAGVPVDDWEAVVAAIGRNVHSARDLQVLTNTPIDYLDFASPLPGLGGKLGIDATVKLGIEREAAPRMVRSASHAAAWPAALERAVPYIKRVYPVPGERMAVIQVEKREVDIGRKAVEAVWRMVPPGGGADQLWVVDDEIDPASWDDLLWVMATRCDPGRDLITHVSTGRFALDATVKLPGETSRNGGRVLEMDAATCLRVDKRWQEYGLPKRFSAGGEE